MKQFVMAMGLAGSIFIGLIVWVNLSSPLKKIVSAVIALLTGILVGSITFNFELGLLACFSAVIVLAITIRIFPKNWLYNSWFSALILTLLLLIIKNDDNDDDEIPRQTMPDGVSELGYIFLVGIVFFVGQRECQLKL